MLEHKNIEYTCNTCKKSYNIEFFLKNNKTLKNCSSCRCKTCEFLNCTTQTSYNISGSKIARFCKIHKEIGMIDIINKTCEFLNCKTIPIYNISGSKIARFCKIHKEIGIKIKLVNF